MTPRQLVETYGIISDQVEKNELVAVLTQLQKSLVYSGAVVEFGCYTGTTSLYIRRILDAHHDGREFHVYDSFAGLPEKTAQDMSPVGEQFQAGKLAASKKLFLREFHKAHLTPPIIHKAWFADLKTGDVPEKVAFAFLDGDYYDSIRIPLQLLEGRLVPGAIIVVDDYANEALPGAARAVDEWAMAHNYGVTSLHSLAVLTQKSH